MKPLYIFLIFFALFITAFADALELGFTAIIPGVGIIIGLPLAMVINITMGAGLVFLLALNGMFHPNLGPAGIVASIIPGIDSLPIWLGLVIAGIFYQMKKEGSEEGAGGVLAKAVSSANSFSFSNPLVAMKSARPIAQTIKTQPQTAANNYNETKQRVPLDLTSPRINADIRHVQKAA